MGIAREKAVAAVLNGFSRNGDASGTVSAAGWVLKAAREGGK
jgi:hypothetical protein